MKLENPLIPETGKKANKLKRSILALFSKIWVSVPGYLLKTFFYVMVRKRFYTFWSKFLCKECWQVVFHAFVWFFGVVFFSYRYLRKTKGIQKIVRIATDQNRVYSPRVIKIANQVQTWLSSWKFLLASFCVCVSIFLFFPCLRDKPRVTCRYEKPNVLGKSVCVPRFVSFLQIERRM